MDLTGVVQKITVQPIWEETLAMHENRTFCFAKVSRLHFNWTGDHMATELVNGFTIYVDGNLIDVLDTFENAKAAAQGHISTADQTKSVQICTASSTVLVGGGASPLRTWNYDPDVNQWVELIR